jgi:ABC-type Fe3+/spermidine/putrescine transport system ATPase subunit
MFLELESLTKRFGDHLAVDQVSLQIERGEILALLGPSGSGKTTTLRLLAGFEVPDHGSVRVDGEDVTRTAPVHRRFGMVFQHYALFPHLDVGENIAFGLQSLGIKGEELTGKVAAALALVDLAGFERRRVGALSGGQQQRVALARALAPEPRVLLLDEPLSNLDPTLRERTRKEIREVINRVGITTVLVTHEQEEAFDLGDRIALLRDGRLEQFGTPDELYDAPANPFVAGFIGRASSLRARIIARHSHGADIEVATGTVRINLAGADTFQPGTAVTLMARPEAFSFRSPANPGLRGTVTARRLIGGSVLFTVALADGSTVEVSAEPQAARVGDSVGLEPAGRGLHLFPEARS